MSNEALKFQNQSTIERFTNVLGDLAPLADFMPRTPYDIRENIKFWQEEKRNPSTGTWSIPECNDQINKLKRLMVIGTDLAIDLLSGWSKVDLPENLKPEPAVNVTNLPSLEMIREEIKKIFKTEGNEPARKYGRDMLQKNNCSDTVMPEAIKGIIDACITEAQESIAAIPETVKEVKEPKKAVKKEEVKSTKNVDAVTKKKEEDEWVELKRRFPTLSENITDEECMMIDTYEKVMVESKTARENEEKRVFDLANQSYKRLEAKDKKEVDKKAHAEYIQLPSETKERLTEENFTIAYHGDTTKLNPLDPLFEFCTGKETIEEERDAMKEIQELTTELIEAKDENKAKAVSKMFFGNFNNETLPIKKGRGWSDAKYEFWWKWVKDGCAEGEWHVYSEKVRQEDQERDKEIVDVKKKGVIIKYNKLDIPDDLLVELSEVVEKNLKNKVKLKDTLEQCKILYKNHDREYSTTEMNTLYAYIKTNVVELPAKEEPKAEDAEGESQTVFMRIHLKDTNPELWKKAKGIKSLGELFNFIKTHDNVPWKDTLNLTYDIVESGNVKEVKNWNDHRIEDWYYKNVEKIKDQKENPKTKPFAGPVIEIPEELDAALTKAGKHTSAKQFKNAIGDILKKYGTTLEIKDMIAQKMSTFTKGFPKNFVTQARAMKIQWLEGVIRWKKLDKLPVPA